MSKGLVMITRPRASAEITAQAVAAKGWDSLIEPMLDIVYRSGPAPDLSSFDALVFTSSNGVEAFAAMQGRAEQVPVYAVGVATAEAARAASFKNVTHGGGTVEHLNALLAGTGVKKVLHLSGAHVAGDIAVPGARVERAILYDARPAHELTPACRAALAQGHVAAILFFSVRTAQVFRDLVGAAALESALSATRALCISDPVVKCLRELSLLDIRAAAAPDLDSVIELLDME